MGERLTLIKSVLGSLPIYYMYLFKSLANIVINGIEQIGRSFFGAHQMILKEFFGYRGTKRLFPKNTDVL